MAYATTTQLQARWRTLTPEELSTATTLLEVASRKIDALCYVDELSDRQLAVLPDVVCDMVRRAMQAHGDAFQYNEYTSDNTWNSTTDIGDIYLRKDEKRLLGISGRIGAI